MEMQMELSRRARPSEDRELSTKLTTCQAEVSKTSCKTIPDLIVEPLRLPEEPLESEV